MRCLILLTNRYGGCIFILSSPQALCPGGAQSLLWVFFYIKNGEYQMIRIAAFVDGFNLYHSIEEMHKPELKWLDLQTLVRGFLRSEETLIQVKYFTALATWNPEKQQRHKRYIRALELLGVEVAKGRFKKQIKTCPKCGVKYKSWEEKRTDVNIAVSMVKGAVLDEYDTALLISGDTDLLPALGAIRELCPGKKLGILFPTNRHHAEMEQAADFSQTIKPGFLESCLLADRIRLPSGKYLTPPEEWFPS